MNELGNKDKNRKKMTSKDKQLSVQGRRVLISERQPPGMTRETVRRQGTLLTLRHLTTQQVRSAPEQCCSTLPSSRSARRVGC